MPILKVECKDATEKELMSRVIDDPEIRAMMMLIGFLKPMTQRKRGAMMEVIQTELAEGEAKKTPHPFCADHRTDACRACGEPEDHEMHRTYAYAEAGEEQP